MAIDQSVEWLYKVSETPKAISEATSLPIQEVIDVASNLCIDRLHIEHIIFFANLLGVKSDLTGLGLIKRQINLLLEKCCDAAQNHELDKNNLHQSVEIFRHLAEKTELQRKVDLYRLARDFKTGTPIFGLHLSGAAEDNTLRPNYARFALDINKHLRGIEKRVPERLEKAARIMRYFVAAPRAEDNVFSAELVKSALNGVAKIKNWDVNTLKQYRDFTEQMFSILLPPKTRGGGHSRHRSEYHVHIDDIFISENESIHVKPKGPCVRINRTFALPKAAVREAEGIDDYIQYEDILPQPSPFEDRRTITDMPLSVLHYLPYTFFWDRRFLNMHDISLLYYYLLDEYEAEKESIIVVSAFIECGIFLGLKLETLMTIILGHVTPSAQKASSKDRLNNFESTEVQIYYSPKGRTMTYEVPQTALGYSQHMAVSQNCLEAASIVELVLPESIARSLEEVIVAFKEHRSGATAVSLFPKEIQLRCRAAIRRFISSFNARFEKNITKESIGRSFKANFESRYGGDPICMSYISAALEISTRTQRFYSRVTPHRLHHEYYRCYNALRKDILNNLNNIGTVESTIVPLRSVFYLERNAGCSSPEELDRISPVGSKVVPKTDSLRTFFKEIANRLERFPVITLQQRCDYHNLYTAWTYIVFQLCSGIRPIADPLINLSSVSFIGNYIYIADKNSKKYKEGRIVNVPTITIQLLRELSRGGGRLQESLCAANFSNHRNDELIFYFTVKDFGTAEVTPERIRLVLIMQGLAELYDYPLNCMRHLLRSVLAERGASSDLIDAVLGHQRYGREMLNVYSTSSAECLSLAVGLIKDIMDELEIGFIRYRG